MKQVPIMIVSDAPDQNSGLARVARDLATLIASTAEFRVATLGWGGLGCQRLPWQQYAMGYREFGERSLPAAWEDFAEGARGIVLTVFDLHRILWLSRPELIEEEGLRRWTQAKRGDGSLKVWSYVPIDATGPMGRLTGMAKDCLLGLDRILAFSPFGLREVVATIGAVEAERRGLDWLPHAIDTRVFKLKEDQHVSPSDPVVGRGGSESDDQRVAAARLVKRVGCVMTNQARKDWGTVAATCRGLVDRISRVNVSTSKVPDERMWMPSGKSVRFWWHVDALERYWSLPALVADYELDGMVEITTPPMDDREIASRMSQCDLTLLPSSEGFGLPIFESIACGVPCLHGAYAGGASLLAAFGLGDLLIAPNGWRLEGIHNSLRPVFEPGDWVKAAARLLEEPLDREWLRSRVEHLDMRLLGNRWRMWLRAGVQDAK